MRWPEARWADGSSAHRRSRPVRRTRKVLRTVAARAVGQSKSPSQGEDAQRLRRQERLLPLTLTVVCRQSIIPFGNRSLNETRRTSRRTLQRAVQRYRQALKAEALAT